MKVFLVRSAIIIGIILFQFNFLNLIFPNNYSVNIILLTVIAWASVAKFEKIWIWILFLGLLTDIIGMGRFGVDGIIFVMLAYLVNFLSKRFLIERRLYEIATVVLFIAMVSLFKNSSDILNFDNLNFGIILEYIKNSLFLWKNLLMEILFSVIMFYLIYTILNKIEQYLIKCENKLIGRL